MTPIIGRLGIVEVSPLLISSYADSEPGMGYPVSIPTLVTNRSRARHVPEKYALDHISVTMNRVAGLIRKLGESLVRSRLQCIDPGGPLNRERPHPSAGVTLRLQYRLDQRWADRYTSRAPSLPPVTHAGGTA